MESLKYRCQSWFVALLLVSSLLLSCGSWAQPCDTPITASNVASPPATLTSNNYGPAIAVAGAYVVVQYEQSNRTYTQLSFSFGASFPSWTKKKVNDLGVASNKLGLYSSKTAIFSVGAAGNKIMAFRYNLGEFTWDSGTQLFNAAARFVNCAGNTDTFLCAIGDSVDSTPVVPDSIQIYGISLDSNPATWTRRSADNMPVCKGRMGVATDGESFMVCNIGSLDSTIRVGCIYSSTGTSFDKTATYPSLAQSNAQTLSVQVASNNVAGTYVVLFATDSAGDIKVSITFNSGTTWATPTSLSAGFKILPDIFVYTDVFVSVYRQGGASYIQFQNSSTPLQLQPAIKLADSLLASFASGGFAKNYIYAVSNSTDGLLVNACIPTSAPTFAPSPSPTKNAATTSSVSYCLQAALLLILGFLSSYH